MKNIIITLMTLIGASIGSIASAGWQLDSCTLTPQVGGGYRITGMSTVEGDLRISPIGPYVTTVEGELAIEALKEIGHCVKQDNLSLVAKCGTPLGDSTIIEPGTPFLYVLKKNDKFFVANSIAPQKDEITERTTPLLMSLPLIEAVSTGSLVWEHPDPGHTGAVKKNNLGLNLENPRNPGKVFVTSGSMSFTSNIYPTCVIWN